MTDLTILQKYIIDLDVFFVDFLEHEIQKYGKDKVYNSLLKECDCSRISATGLRMQQTIDYRYKNAITQILHVIKLYFSDTSDERIQEVITLHLKNIKFEAENPPIDYKQKQKERKEKIKNKSKQTRIKSDENGEPLKSKAEIKLAKQIAKINALKFNFKLTKQ